MSQRFADSSTEVSDRVEFLVQIGVNVEAVPPTERARLYSAEAERAAELVAENTLLALWRLPGTTSNIGIWSAHDATDLHAALTSLPLWPYLTVQVQALADHPSAPSRHPFKYLD